MMLTENGDRNTGQRRYPLKPRRNTRVLSSPCTVQRSSSLRRSYLGIWIPRVRITSRDWYTYPLLVPPPNKKSTKSKTSTGKSTAGQPTLKPCVSAYLPVLSPSVLIDTIRAAMNAAEGQGAAGGIPVEKENREQLECEGITTLQVVSHAQHAAYRYCL
ncbi:hypothetical protein DFH94DRAFT_473541 [Russula ochroleuca]|uniref:Uncharacterized protein n=1 Tax=Russula ochroleuca TaxID=152965 RepID=A0A9P5MW66_9AGAM|nr:hypothetical protein DFH94DRAFT_473541 [Russula ochroleuca]